jgi:hypothetical protein
LERWSIIVFVMRIFILKTRPARPTCIRRCSAQVMPIGHRPILAGVCAQRRKVPNSSKRSSQSMEVVTE